MARSCLFYGITIIIMTIMIINQGQDLLDQQEQSHLVDFNESIGKASRNSSPQIVGKYWFDQEDNDNGERLVSLCENNRLIFNLHHQPHENSHMWTW